MLPLPLRLDLRHAKGFFTRARRYHSSHFMVSLVPSHTPLFAIIVSKKHVRTAVARNRLKRRIRAVVQSFNTVSAGHFVIHAKSGAHSLTRIQILQELAPLCGVSPVEKYAR